MPTRSRCCRPPPTRPSGKDSFGIPDPDVTRVRVDVEVRHAADGQPALALGREAYIALYTTQRTSPPRSTSRALIPLEFRHAPVLQVRRSDRPGDLGLTQAEIDALDELVLPTARDIRLTVRAVADEDPAYFANDANIGKPVQVSVRRESTDETRSSSRTCQARFAAFTSSPIPPPVSTGTSQHAVPSARRAESPAIIQRLAQAIGVDHEGA